MCLAVVPAWAGSPAAALSQARQAAGADRAAVVAARLAGRAVAARAAILAEREVVAAAAVRGLEAETAADAAALAALRARGAAARAGLAADEAALARLLPVMQRLAVRPAAALLAVPGPPVDAVRGLLVVQGVAAEISQRAAAVRQESRELSGLAAAAQAELVVLTRAVRRQQTAEAALSAQIAAARVAELADADAAAAAAARAAAADKQISTLQAMLRRLAAARVPAGRPAVPPGDVAAAETPVAGPIVQRFGDDTAAGPAVGVSYRAPPGALVVAPCAGPVLFADRFQSYGNLVIVDCGGGYDFVLSGMTRLDVAAGQHLARGQPVGEMLGYDTKNPTRQPLLYVELRQDGTPVDPALLLAVGGSG
jgi:septal ring factor EnvC (AmiA/AmiB activator)